MIYGHVEQSWTSSPLVMCHRPLTATTRHITLDMTMIQPAHSDSKKCDVQ